MSLIAISQRVAVDTQFGERRNCLDQLWTKFMMACGLTPIPVPNEAEAARSLCGALPLSGILLTGGNDLSAYGGDAPERDTTENALIDIAQGRTLPVLGVCRGMQMIQHRFGIRLGRVTGHVARRQVISIDGKPAEVNSYHNFGATETRPPLEAWALCGRWGHQGGTPRQRTHYGDHVASRAVEPLRAHAIFHSSSNFLDHTKCALSFLRRAVAVAWADYATSGRNASSNSPRSCSSNDKSRHCVVAERRRLASCAVIART